MQVAGTEGNGGARTECAHLEFCERSLEPLGVACNDGDVCAALDEEDCEAQSKAGRTACDQAVLDVVPDVSVQVRSWKWEQGWSASETTWRLC